MAVSLYTLKQCSSILETYYPLIVGRYIDPTILQEKDGLDELVRGGGINVALFRKVTENQYKIEVIAEVGDPFTDFQIREINEVLMDYNIVAEPIRF